MREKYNIPIWLGETGENSNLWFTDAIELVESHGIGWAWWPLKKLGFNNPLEVKPNAGYLALVDYWNGKGGKPSAKAAKKALRKELRCIKSELNAINAASSVQGSGGVYLSVGAVIIIILLILLL